MSLISYFPQGGRGKPGMPLEPAQVYRDTRPTDWLPMPTEANVRDNEMYLLFHIPDGVSALLAFTGFCTGSYTVALGTMANGAFVQSSSVSVAGGTVFEAELMADDYVDLTGDGMKQVMVKVSGSFDQFILTKHSKNDSPVNVVEIACRLPECSQFVLQNPNIRYFAWYGPNKDGSTRQMFLNCTGLRAVLALDTSYCTGSMDQMFYGCQSLLAIPRLDTSNATDMTYMFYQCKSLPAVPEMDTRNVKSMQRMFQDCESLTHVPKFNLAKATDLGFIFFSCKTLAEVPKLEIPNNATLMGAFNGCSLLKIIPPLDISKATNVIAMFEGCGQLSKVTFLPDAAWSAPLDIFLNDCALGRAALVALFESLPTITEGKTITVTGNYGVSELTDADKAIATGKGWTLTL